MTSHGRLLGASSREPLSVLTLRWDTSGSQRGSVTIRRGLLRNPEADRVKIFLAMLRAAGLPQPHQEYRFEPSRRWRADYCWPAHNIILKVEGGIWSRGRHTRGAGYLADVSKYNHAAVLGYRVVRCVPKDLCTPETISMLTKLLSELAA